MEDRVQAEAAHRAYWLTLLRGEEPTDAYDDEEAEYQRAWDASAHAVAGPLEAEIADLRAKLAALTAEKPRWTKRFGPVVACDHAELEDAYAAAHGRITEVEAERDKYRELLDEIGVMAANAPEDGDSFGLLEQIAMRIAAVDVPDTTPIEEWPDPENPITGRTPGAAAMAVTVNGEPVPRTSGNALPVSPEMGAVMAENREMRHLNAAQGAEITRLRGLLDEARIADPGDGGALGNAIDLAAGGGGS